MAMDCKGNGVSSNYNSNSESSIGDSDANNGGGNDIESGRHIQQSPKASAEESAAVVMVMVAAMATDTTII